MDDRTQILLRRASVSRGAPGAFESGAGQRAEAGEPVSRGDEEGARRSPPTLLAVVDMTAQDAGVVEAARALAAARRATIVLLHVTRPVSRWQRAWWERMAAVEAAAQRRLRWLARRLLRRGLSFQTAVRFGETIEQVTDAAVAVGATVVVAASRPARWLWWRDRDRRLRRSLDVPLIVVPARGGVTDGGARITRRESSCPSQPRSAA